MNKKQTKVEKDVEKIMTNHLPHIQADIVEIKTNQKWLTKLIWGAISASGAGAVIGGINLI